MTPSTTAGDGDDDGDDRRVALHASAASSDVGAAPPLPSPSLLLLFLLLIPLTLPFPSPASAPTGGRRLRRLLPQRLPRWRIVVPAAVPILAVVVGVVGGGAAAHVHVVDAVEVEAEAVAAAVTATPVDPDPEAPSAGSGYYAAGYYAHAYAPPTIDIHDGRSNLVEGLRLFDEGRRHEASAYLWRAVLLHGGQEKKQKQKQKSQQQSSSDDNDDDGDGTHHHYKVDEAFAPFLRCYLLENKIVDGLLFVATESYMRGQDEMGRVYLEQALDRGPDHDAAKKLRGLVEELNRLVVVDYDDDYGENKNNNLASKRSRLLGQMREIRDAVDISNPNNTGQKMTKGGSSAGSGGGIDDAIGIPDRPAGINGPPNLDSMSPEELYDLGSHHFNTKRLPQASYLFELSCQKSDRLLSVACTNAVYLRTQLCDWGHRGEGFERDMRIIMEVMKVETRMYRTVVMDVTDGMRRSNGLGYHRNDNDNEEEGRGGVVYWRRGASVHPHMMLGYPLSVQGREIDDDDDGDGYGAMMMLKRYAAESTAGLDELRARAESAGHADDGRIPDLPPDLPYDVREMRDEYLRERLRHEQRQQQQRRQSDDGKQPSPPPPLKVGFVACSFDSKAVLYLSHDMFRFFNPDVVEVHVFSTGPPSDPRFVRQTMRGVDWRKRVMENVGDHFHDVREYAHDHVALARYIRDHDIRVLVEWDGYARQGTRAAGLLALRPAPVQVTHQEFLMTSGAQYVDYIVTDKVTSPKGLEGLYSEKFLYMPNHFFSKGHRVQDEVIPPTLEYVHRKEGEPFRLGVGTPQENACLSSDPLGTTGNEEGKEKEGVSFVYCNFNKFLKNNPETMRSWMRILERVPGSILCLLENPREGVANLRRFVSEESAAAAAADVDGDGDALSDDLNARIHFIPWEKNPFDHQRRSFSLCNAMLDSHPYNGHTTAQDALYAGVPIVTRSDGYDMSSRVTTSANVVLGLGEELNARDGVAQYVDIAVRLGTDATWFGEVRARLVETCLRVDPMHPYWDVPRYVDNFQRGLKMAWDRFLDGKEADHIEVMEDDSFEGAGTMEADMVARERKREEAKKRRSRERLLPPSGGEEL